MELLNAYATAIKVALCLALCASLAWGGYHVASLKYEGEIAKAQAETVTAVNAKERELRGTIDTLTADADKVKNDEKLKDDQRVADYRNGSKRVHVVIAACPPANPSPGPANTETHAELLPEVAASVIAVANDADDAVRDLNECVDKYNAVKDALDPSR